MDVRRIWLTSKFAIGGTRESMSVPVDQEPTNNPGSVSPLVATTTVSSGPIAAPLNFVFGRKGTWVKVYVPPNIYIFRFRLKLSMTRQI
jgi:hypothetical protein